MNATPRVSRIKGFEDLYPPDSDAFTFLEDCGRRVFARYGYAELRTPILEKTELFCRGIGEETDVVQKEMYTFPDRKGRSLTMRPEATAGVVRSYIESGKHQPGLVSKYYTFGPMFRYERPQKGRQRQFHQVNAEVFGAASPQTDAELILMLWAFLAEAGLSDLSLQLNSLGCPECRPQYKALLSHSFAGLDQGKLCADCVRRSQTNPLRVLDCKVPECRQLTADAPRMIDHLCPACGQRHEQVVATLQAVGLPFVINHRLVRGLDYYVQTTFEVVSGAIGAQSSVAGGGRYDGLIPLLGGPEVPSAGFACGMERLAMLLPPPPEPADDFYFAVIEAGAMNEALLLAEGLRRAGLAGEISLEARGLKGQLRHAGKRGARTVCILGPEEAARRQVVVKDMAGGEQTTVNYDDLVAVLTARKG